MDTDTAPRASRTILLSRCNHRLASSIRWLAVARQWNLHVGCIASSISALVVDRWIRLIPSFRPPIYLLSLSIYLSSLSIYLILARHALCYSCFNLIQSSTSTTVFLHLRSIHEREEKRGEERRRERGPGGGQSMRE